LGLPSSASADGVQAAAKIALGRHLFFDARLSADGSVSCATCHQPEHAFTDGRALARGIDQRLGTRNTPSVVNAALQREQFWDGRRDSIEAQVLDPLLSANEHGLADLTAVIELLKHDRDYATQFRAAFVAIDPARRHVAGR
jgi:cytochrome c peroxidase